MNPLPNEFYKIVTPVCVKFKRDKIRFVQIKEFYNVALFLNSDFNDKKG